MPIMHVNIIIIIIIITMTVIYVLSGNKIRSEALKIHMQIH